MDSRINNSPLVSICATFFNAERYIHRFIESCLGQTYRNIEIVLVDDLSTDKSEEVIREYATRDSRVVYHKNVARVGLGESELTMFSLARGEYCIMVGADDWLARDFIEHGVRTFLAHPETAGIIPRGIWLSETTGGAFTLVDSRFDDFSAPMARSAEWFMKHLYRPRQLYMSALALVRSKDYVHAMKYYLDNYYYNLPESASSELRRFSKMAFGMDSVVFPEMLTRHRSVVFDSSMRYIKIGLPEGQANNLDLFHKSIGEIFKASWYQLRTFTPIYKEKWPNYYWSMKMFKGGEALSVMFVGFFRNGLRFSFLRMGDNGWFAREFFSAFAWWELIIAAMYGVFQMIYRFVKTVKMKLLSSKDTRRAEAIFSHENFLNSEHRFSIDK